MPKYQYLRIDQVSICAWVDRVWPPAKRRNPLRRWRLLVTPESAATGPRNGDVSGASFWGVPGLLILTGKYALADQPARTCLGSPMESSLPSLLASNDIRYQYVLHTLIYAESRHDTPLSRSFAQSLPRTPGVTPGSRAQGSPERNSLQPPLNEPGMPHRSLFGSEIPHL